MDSLFRSQDASAASSYPKSEKQSGSLSSGSDGRVQTDAVLFGSGASRTAQFGSSVSSSSSRWVLLQEVTPAAGYLIQPCLLRWASLQTVCICSCGSRHGVIGEAYRRWRAPFVVHLPTHHAHAGYGFVWNRRGRSLGGCWLCSVGVATTHPMTCLVPLVLFPTAFEGGGVARAVLLIRRELLLYCARLSSLQACCIMCDCGLQQQQMCRNTSGSGVRRRSSAASPGISSATSRELFGTITLEGQDE